MPFQRGSGTVNVELARIQTYIESEVEPELTMLRQTTSELKADRDSLKGSLRVIIWLNGVILGLVVAMIVSLFSWGLNHISLKAEFGRISTPITASNQ